MQVASIDLKALHGLDRSAYSLSNRLVWLDSARSLALTAMIVFHFARDLELFDMLPPGTTATGGWAVFARVIAGFFIFLSGVSLVIAHASGFRRKSWAKRLIVISGAALLVSVATYASFPSQFVYFGILHCIAACSLIGAVMLRAPVWFLLSLVLMIFGATAIWSLDLVTSPWLVWTGLRSTTRPSLDFLPLIPWLSAFFAGMAFAKAFPVMSYDLPLPSNRLTHYVIWPGRHSLAVYLIHQPILLAALWVAIGLTR